MAQRQYRIDEFLGINQSRDENGLHSSFSPDACNMDTEFGNLTVAKGYVKHVNTPVPGSDPIFRMTTFIANGVEQQIVLTRSAIYRCHGGVWDQIYDYGALAMPAFDFVQARIDNVDYLLIGCGEYPIVKYNGLIATPFGSEAKQSNKPVCYLAMYKGRLFCAGTQANPSRLYWSQLPGSTRSIEDWSPVEASPNVEGGHTEIGDTGNDPIVGLHALSNQLLIFKRHSLYRLIGDKPSNFIVECLDPLFSSPPHTAIVPYGDALLFMTKDALQAFNGVSVRPLADSQCIYKLLKNASIQDCRGAYARGKFYFSLREGSTDLLVEYDVRRHTYMLRRGFSIRDICSRGDHLYLVNNARYICRFNEGNTYDGQPIEAWWKTPVTDLMDKGAVKALRSLGLRGTSDGSSLLVDVCVGNTTATHSLLMPEDETDVLEVPLKNEGRTFSFKLYNEHGGHFSIKGGLELLFEQWRRVE